MCCIIGYRGARHGFKMNGKLARLEVQDSSLTSSPAAAAQSDGSSTDEEAEEKTRVSKYVTIYFFTFKCYLVFNYFPCSSWDIFWFYFWLHDYFKCWCFMLSLKQEIKSGSINDIFLSWQYWELQARYFWWMITDLRRSFNEISTCITLSLWLIENMIIWELSPDGKK